MDYNIQTLQDVKHLVLVTLDECESIARLDSNTLSTANGKFVKSNLLMYFVLLNSWGHMIMTASSEEAWVYIKMRITQQGLVHVIRETSDLADMIIHGEAPDWDYTYGYLSLLAKTDYSVCTQQLQDVLQILRYPKRFSPRFADIVLADSLEKFLALNTAVKLTNRIEAPWYWEREIRSVVHGMLKGFSFSLTDGYFSNGTSATTDKLLLNKLKTYALTEPCFPEFPGVGISSASGSYPRWRDTRKLRSSVSVLAVPKSYKAARIIAKEPVASAFALQAIAQGLRQCLRDNGYTFTTTSDGRYCLLDDSCQEESHRLSRIGSIDGSYATIDLTSASDSLSERFVRSVLPSSVVEAAEPYRCAYIEAQGKTRIMQMFATSGSPLTFIVESIIFSAIAVCATNFAALFRHERLLPPRVYGDDIIIDDRACTVCIEILEAVGCLPNLGKTFHGSTPLGYYRESCGEEYLNGLPMHTRYFPRKPFGPNAEGIAAICDLQHRLFDNWKIRMFLSQVVRSLEPRMTCHPASSPSDDLWDVIAQPHSVVNKYNTESGKRFKYLALKAKYTVTSLTTDETRLLDTWYYYLYLLEGPLYCDPLDKLLGVSTSRKRYRLDSCRSESAWTLTVE